MKGRAEVSELPVEFSSNIFLPQIYRFPSLLPLFNLLLPSKKLIFLTIFAISFLTKRWRCAKLLCPGSSREEKGRMKEKQRRGELKKESWIEKMRAMKKIAWKMHYQSSLQQEESSKSVKKMGSNLQMQLPPLHYLASEGDPQPLWCPLFPLLHPL